MARVSFCYPAWGDPDGLTPSRVCDDLEKLGRSIAKAGGIEFGEIDVSHGVVRVMAPEDAIMLDYAVEYVAEGLAEGVTPTERQRRSLIVVGDANPSIDMLCAYEV